MPDFHVRFTRDIANDLIEAYEGQDQGGNNDHVTDEQALEIGQSICAGRYDYSDLQRLYEWKNSRYAWARGANRFELQCEEHWGEVKEAFSVACTAKTDRTAISVLAGLDGVGVPTASAFLTMMFPEKFTIIDIRALRSLLDPDEATKFNRSSVSNYLSYLNFCRQNYADYADSLRNFDKALWQFNGEQ